MGTTTLNIAGSLGNIRLDLAKTVLYTLFVETQITDRKSER